MLGMTERMVLVLCRIAREITASPQGEGLVLRGLYPASQYFSHAPGLGDATASKMRVARVEDFANGTNSVVLEVPGKCSKKFSGAGLVVGMHFQPCIYKRPD